MIRGTKKLTYQQLRDEMTPARCAGQRGSGGRGGRGGGGGGGSSERSVPGRDEHAARGARPACSRSSASRRSTRRSWRSSKPSRIAALEAVAHRSAVAGLRPACAARSVLIRPTTSATTPTADEEIARLKAVTIDQVRQRLSRVSRRAARRAGRSSAISIPSRRSSKIDEMLADWKPSTAVCPHRAAGVSRRFPAASTRSSRPTRPTPIYLAGLTIAHERPATRTIRPWCSATSSSAAAACRRAWATACGRRKGCRTASARASRPAPRTKSAALSI